MNSLKDRLYNYEQTPPVKVWEMIAASLDESCAANEFPAKLYNAEAEPPISAWDKIAGALDGEHAAAIPMPRKSYPLFRYAAAVVIVGIITFSYLKWGPVGEGSSNKQVVAGTKDTVTPNENVVAGTSENESLMGQIPKEKKATAAVNDENEENIDKISKSQAKKSRTNYAISEEMDPSEPIYAYNEHTPNLADRYVMLITPNGIIRMSKKLGDMICCVTGEEQDEECKDQIKKWQEKLATSPVAPTPGNFMDILSLVNSLSEDDL